MKPIETKTDHTHILYDGELIENVGPQIFDIEHWKKKNALIGFADGRGTTYFVRIRDEDYVLRHYRRGGAMTRLTQDLYLWMGVEKSRSWAEWRLLARLKEMGLPVPQPLAAQVSRVGLFCRADILIKRFIGAEPLAEKLKTGRQSARLWESVGACIRRFHELGLDHQDLNASNILCDEQQVYLIDFDKCLLRSSIGTGWKENNLARLHRSLVKFKSRLIDFHFSETDWEKLLSGYREPGNITLKEY